MKNRLLSLFALWALVSLPVTAQVFTEGLRLNPAQYDQYNQNEKGRINRAYLKRETSNDTIPLPFFDDFSGKDFSWAPSYNLVGKSIRALRFTSPSRAHALGLGGLNIRTTNSGSKWENAGELNNQDVFDASILSDNEIWACGKFGWLARSTDGGQSWTTISNPVLPNRQLRAISFQNSLRGVVVDSAGLIYNTQDGGSTWTRFDTTGNGFLATSVCWVGNSVVAAGRKSQVARSSNGGNSFTISQLFASRFRDFRKVRFFDGNFGLLLGDSGLIFKTIDQGITWRGIRNAGTATLLDVAANPANDRLVWVVGSNGTLLYSQNKGEGWAQIRSGFSTDLQCIDLLNEYRGWIGTSDGHLLQVVLDPFHPYSRFWEPNSGVLVNNTFANKPISLGVATFDGVNRRGLPYSNIRNKSGACDTLTSALIDMGGFTGVNLFLSFFYQPANTVLQTIPDPEDSLVLQMEGPKGSWVSLWNAKGIADTSRVKRGFKYVSVPVPDSCKYKGGRFRFVSFGNQNGEFDVWNLDYVRLDSEHNETDSTERDYAMAEPFNRLLKSYSALPMEQFRHILQNNPDAWFSDSLVSAATNLNGAGLTNINGFFFANKVDPDGKENLLTLTNEKINGLGNPFGPFQGRKLSLLRTDFQPGFQEGGYRTFEYGIGLNQDAQFDIYTLNDSLFGSFNASTVMASDDGTAELTRFVGETNSIGAQKFYLPKDDTLTDVQLYFVRTPENLEQTVSFAIVVYDSINVETNYATDPPLARRTFILPATTDSINKFLMFNLRDVDLPRRILKGGRHFYVGWQQGVIDNSNEVRVGADINFRHPHPFYFKSGTVWSSYSADNYSLMIRPVFGPVSVTSVKASISAPENPFYPNPGTGIFRNAGWVKNLKIRNVLGQTLDEVQDLPRGQELQTFLPKGLYVFSWEEISGKVVSQRILIQ